MVPLLLLFVGWVILGKLSVFLSLFFCCWSIYVIFVDLFVHFCFFGKFIHLLFTEPVLLFHLFSFDIYFVCFYVCFGIFSLILRRSGPEELGVIVGAQGTDKERLLAKDLAEGHMDELTPHQKERESETVQV